VYGPSTPGPLEDGEIDPERQKSFTTCVRRSYREQKRKREMARRAERDKVRSDEERSDEIRTPCTGDEHYTCSYFRIIHASSLTTGMILFLNPNPFHDSLRSSQKKAEQGEEDLTIPEVIG